MGRISDAIFMRQNGRHRGGRSIFRRIIYYLAAKTLSPIFTFPGHLSDKRQKLFKSHLGGIITSLSQDSEALFLCIEPF